MEPSDRTEPTDTNGITFTNCFICAACSGLPGTPLLDRPLRREPGVGAVLTGAGPLGVGYVLVVPEGHWPDIATALGVNPRFLGFVRRILAEYKQLFGAYTFWEHGSASLDVRTSGCVTHAHLNVIPKTSLTAPPDSRTIEEWSDLTQEAVSPYLLLGGSDEPLRIGEDSGVSQHYRREWARIIGNADRWDYALTGGSELQKATAERYGSW